MAYPKRKPHPNAELVPEGQRPCPICGEPLVSESERAITVDVCSQHGVWLDRGELEKIVSKAKGLTRRTATLAAQQAKTRGKIEGSFFGLLSLLWE